MTLSGHAEALAASLAKANLVPGPAAELIPEGFTPTTKLDVSFDDKAVELGNFFRAGECKKAPSIAFPAEAGAPSSAAYLLIFADPDAPTPDDPRYAFWRHWVVPGLQPLSPGPSRQTTLVAETKEPLTQYHPPGPQDLSKPHRYLFLLYRESERLDLAKEDVGGEEFDERRSFKLAEFVKYHRLELVGVNWMTCAGDGWKEE
ncbi:PEBP-like protein [Sodiomyces alkalinus F11]|uniref:PEBP-like protein n=1 Tax=Sodiomyces alkalinus (strain CBS 110278 / VKM F-3762 / F11) TaxID=1314773 RepID=A0A3N2Q159_SODAK|nr:PEBP-like protein [Sodiomyces alkalinus F11]ROT40446.1 PEBP-like protein [Sodiomyces alkalinus F11]